MPARTSQRASQPSGQDDTDLSGRALAILEVLVRYKTQPIIDSLLDTADRPELPYIFSLRKDQEVGDGRAHVQAGGRGHRTLGVVRGPR